MTLMKNMGGVLWLTRIRKIEDSDPVGKHSCPACPVLSGRTVPTKTLATVFEIKNLKLCNFGGSYVAGKSCGQSTLVTSPRNSGRRRPPELANQ